MEVRSLTPSPSLACHRNSINIDLLCARFERCRDWLPVLEGFTVLGDRDRSCYKSPEMGDKILNQVKSTGHATMQTVEHCAFQQCLPGVGRLGRRGGLCVIATSHHRSGFYCLY